MIQRLTLTLFLLLACVHAQDQKRYFYVQPVMLGLSLLSANSATYAQLTYEQPLALGKTLVIRPNTVLGTEISGDTARTKTVQIGAGLGERFYYDDRNLGFYLQPLLFIDFLSERYTETNLSVQSLGFVHKGLWYLGFCSRNPSSSWFWDFGVGYQLRHASEYDNYGNDWKSQILGFVIDTNFGFGLGW